MNNSARAHLEHLKPLPSASKLIDKCIECGFCEPKCPSHLLTLSPRQRIVAWRELARRDLAGEAPGKLAEDYVYMGLDTCAGCGLCASACPVGIDTGALVREVRGRRQSALAQGIGTWSGQHFATVATLARVGLTLGHGAASVVGDKMLGQLSGGAWRAGMPRAAARVTQHGAGHGTQLGEPVVYFPSCASRIFGAGQAGDVALPDVIQTLLVRAGFAPRLPRGFEQLCCGQMLASKGQAGPADASSERLEQALAEASENGRYPIVTDASACSLRMQQLMAGRLKIQDFHEFAHDALLPRLILAKQAGPIALHINCSVQKSGSDKKLQAVMAACAEHIVQPAGVGCCGFGGERGFVVPELNRHALRNINPELPSACACGVSTNRTCEIGLSAETGRPYRSLAWLLELCSRPG